MLLLMLLQVLLLMLLWFLGHPKCLLQQRVWRELLQHRHHWQRRREHSSDSPSALTRGGDVLHEVAPGEQRSRSCAISRQRSPKARHRDLRPCVARRQRSGAVTRRWLRLPVYRVGGRPLGAARRWRRRGPGPGPGADGGRSEARGPVQRRAHGERLHQRTIGPRCDRSLDAAIHLAEARSEAILAEVLPGSRRPRARRRKPR
mmetsp:Transcript_19393/g.55240  ORF Transcript_19393/g.55240 Transcript_19393/m.55240 type:complete len:203 (+) Transcript_19393:136-744(+)